MTRFAMQRASQSSTVSGSKSAGTHGEEPLYYEKILGVRFFRGAPSEAINHFLKIGGLLVIPAAPALTKLKYDDQYRRALLEADVALLDSGLVATAWKVITGRSVTRISGVRYLDALLHHEIFREKSNVLWIVGSRTIEQRARDWLNNHGYETRRHSFHVCGGPLAEDHDLLLKIEQTRPPQIIVATAGGTQEKLGAYLRTYLLYRPAIHCIGAGLAFLTGLERPIPQWAETARIGWLLRLIAQPQMILPRIGIAIGLIGMLLRHRAELPPLQPRWADV